jgi:hypothetical protein
MKFKLYLLIFLFLPAFLYAQDGPKFEAGDGSTTINTGSHMRGKEVNYEIPIRNSGNRDLKIFSVATSCGCSSALLSSDSLKPGETGTIKFTFNGNGYGELTKNVMVSTNEAEGNNNHSITMVMKMVEPLTLNPASIISSGKVGDEITQTATILNSLDKTVTITEVTSNSPAVKVTSDKTSLNEGETASLSISVKLYEESPVNAAIIIKTSEGEFQLPILVDIKSN